LLGRLRSEEGDAQLQYSNAKVQIYLAKNLQTDLVDIAMHLNRISKLSRGDLQEAAHIGLDKAIQNPSDLESILSAVYRCKALKVTQSESYAVAQQGLADMQRYETDCALKAIDEKRERDVDSFSAQHKIFFSPNSTPMSSPMEIRPQLSISPNQFPMSSPMEIRPQMSGGCEQALTPPPSQMQQKEGEGMLEKDSLCSPVKDYTALTSVVGSIIEPSENVSMIATMCMIDFRRMITESDDKRERTEEKMRKKWDDLKIRFEERAMKAVSDEENADRLENFIRENGMRSQKLSESLGLSFMENSFDRKKLAFENAKISLNKFDDKVFIFIGVFLILYSSYLMFLLGSLDHNTGFCDKKFNVSVLFSTVYSLAIR
jgi:hypothetical protein